MSPSKPLSVVLLAGALAFVSIGPADAQGQHARPRSGQAVVGRAVPRPAGQPVYRPTSGYHYYRPYYSRPYYSYYYSPYYDWPWYGWPYYGTSFGFSLSYGYPWYSYPGYYYPGYYSPYPYARGYYGGAYGYGPYDPGEEQSTGGIRFLVKPKQAEVYVDGRYAGLVDDFDGTFQKLTLPSGQHEIVLYLDGYRAVHQTLMVPPGETLKVSYQMQPLAKGEANEPRPTPPPEAAAPPPSSEPEAPAPAPPREPGVRAELGEFGTLSIRVQPADAEIIVDGASWHQPRGADRLVLQLSAGAHRVEVRKDGYETFSADVQVQAGGTTPLNVSILQKQAS